MFRVTDDDGDDDEGLRRLERRRERERKTEGGQRSVNTDVLERVVPGELGLSLLQDLHDVGLP